MQVLSQNHYENGVEVFVTFQTAYISYSKYIQNRKILSPILACVKWTVHPA